AAQPGAAAAVAPAAAKYPFRLDVASAANPDEDFIEGPVVTVEMLPAAIKKPFKWWIIPIALVVLAGIGVGLWFLISKGTAQVPDVVGKQFAEAETVIKDANLVAVQKEVQLTEAPEGQVLDQDPKPGGEVKEGTEINLIVEGAEPLVVVPNVVKLIADEAKKRITEAGLTAVESGTAVTEGFEANQVTSQKPAAGEEVKPLTTVELVVASQRLVDVPDVTFKPLALAKQQITAVGLQITEKEPEVADANVAPGNVKRQTPAAGTKVPPNSTVELVAAAPTTQVPSLVRRRIADAQLVLQQNGLSLGTVWGTYTASNASTVLITSQTPAAGTQVARGSNVNVRVPCIGFGCGLIKLQGVKILNLPTRTVPFERRQEQE
ncbi:MAG: PASTA domain-containing protein, partial [Pyrinomonadaceae bacterium]